MKFLDHKKNRTKRYCTTCEDKRTFIYNPVTKHSQCIECGHRNYGKRLQEWEQID